MSCATDLDLTLCLPVGTSPVWAITITDPDTASTAVDITGASFEFYAKESATDADEDAIFTLTSGEGEIAITDADAGEAQIFNTVAKSGLLTAGRVYKWSLRITFESGEYRVIRRGDLNAEAA